MDDNIPQRSLVILDDDEFMRELIADMAEEIGCLVVMKESQGEIALQLLSSRKIDLLIFDLNMPGMDGIEFMRHLALKGFQGGIIPVSGADSVFLSKVELLARAHGLNLLGTLHKPLDKPEFHATIARLGQASKVSKQNSQNERLTPEEVLEGIRCRRIELYLQPKVSVTSKKVLGAECLARWNHPTRGVVGPDAFIPVIEQHGMIDEFTMLVLRRAAEMQSDLSRQHCNLKIAVNVSMDNLNRLDLPELYEKIVLEAGSHPGNICLEITETRLMDNLAISLDILTRLRLKGFFLSIDDFGTGYATMENLKRLPFNELKIDRAFVFNASLDRHSSAILESSVKLGRFFSLGIVAEGVESQQDWDLVAEMGIDEVQGYFIARPMAVKDFLGWKNEWSANDE